jgi:hypothetical protein
MGAIALHSFLAIELCRHIMPRAFGAEGLQLQRHSVVALTAVLLFVLLVGAYETPTRRA